MTNPTIGNITSEPNSNGEHEMQCPKCHTSFLSQITKNDNTELIDDAVCINCMFSDEPKLFLAAAHQAEINKMAKDYATRELKNMFRKIGR